MAAEAHLAGLAGWFPGRLLAVGRGLVLSALPDHVVTCLGYTPVGRARRVAAGLAYRAAIRAARLRWVRLDASWQHTLPAT